MTDRDAILRAAKAAAYADEIGVIDDREEAIDRLIAEATAAAEQRLRERIEALSNDFEGLAANYGYAVGQMNGRTASAWSEVRRHIRCLNNPPPASPRQGEPVDGLDAAWKAAEAALPENVGPEGWRLMVKQTDPDDDEPDQPWCASAVSPAFYLGENDDDIRVGYGLTPAAALRALTTALRARQ